MQKWTYRYVAFTTQKGHIGINGYPVARPDGRTRRTVHERVSIGVVPERGLVRFG